jgi:CRISPR-associated protein Cmr6
MARPLPKHRQTTDPFAAGPNFGLVWNKFFDGWGGNFSTAPGGPQKTAWINEFAGKTTGDTGRLEAETGRLKALANSLGGSCEPFTTTAPFVTGTGLEHPVENGFSWHHTLGVPYLSGSSVKGLVRAWAEHWEQVGEIEITRIFGSPADDGGVGSVIVFDALPTGPVKLIAEVLTPHDGGWRQGNADAPSDWHSPVPIPWLAIAPGAKFLFAIAPRPGAKGGADDTETAMGWLKDALEWIGAGARTAVGLGRFQSEADRPFQEGDVVIVLEDRGGKAKQGDKAKIISIFQGGQAKIKLERGGTGSELVVFLSILKRP